MTYFNTVMDNQISISTCTIMSWSGDGRFPHFLAFVKGVQRSLVDSLHKGPVIRTLMQGPKELFNKHSNDRLTWDAKTLGWWYCNIFTGWQLTVYNSQKFALFWWAELINRHAYCFYLNSIHHWPIGWWGTERDETSWLLSSLNYGDPWFELWGSVLWITGFPTII